MQNNQWKEIGIKIFYISILIFGCCVAWMMFTYSFWLIVDIILDIIRPKNKILQDVLFYGGVCLGFCVALYIFVRLLKKIIKKTKLGMPNDDQMVTLIKSAAKEGQFNKIPAKEMEDIYQYGLGLVKDRSYDYDLIKAVNQFKTEIEIRQSWENDSKVTSKKKTLIIYALILLPWIILYLINVFVDHVFIDSIYIQNDLFLLTKQAFVLLIIYIVYKIIIGNKNNISKILFDLTKLPLVILGYYLVLIAITGIGSESGMFFLVELVIVCLVISMILCAIGLIIKIFKRNVNNVKTTPD